MQLDKEDTRRSNLNGRCVSNILILLFVFIMFNKLTCKSMISYCGMKPEEML